MDYKLLSECADKIKMTQDMENRIVSACHTAANKKTSVIRFKRKHIRFAAVTACLLIMLSVPVMAAGGGQFSELLYRLFPETAGNFVPVQLSCEDNGVRMEVVASYIHDNTAEIYIAITDLLGGRIDHTVDLFDSYDIGTFYNSSATCHRVSYNPDTSTATFLVVITQDNNKKLSRERITFNVKQLLCGKQQFEAEIKEIDLAEIRTGSETYYADKRGCGSADKILFEKYSKADKVEMLVPQGSLAQPTKGVAVTAMGYIGDELRIQVKYEDIRQTDNHGYVYLKDKVRGQIIKADASISAFAADNSSSYEEYIFTDILADRVDEYSLYGYFVTSDTLINGNWKVSFKVGRQTE